MSHAVYDGESNIDLDIEGLAQETDTPVEVVQTIYNHERARLERSARIKTYIPVLAKRHVKSVLREKNNTR